MSCELNSSYKSSQLFLKLCMCFSQVLKMCKRFGCNPQIDFVIFFRSLNFVIFGSPPTKAYIHWVACERNSSYNSETLQIVLSRSEDAHEVRLKSSDSFLSLVSQLELLPIIYEYIYRQLDFLWTQLLQF